MVNLLPPLSAGLKHFERHHVSLQPPSWNAVLALPPEAVTKPGKPVKPGAKAMASGLKVSVVNCSDGQKGNSISEPATSESFGIWPPTNSTRYRFDPAESA